MLECSQLVTGVAVLLKGYIRKASVGKFCLQLQVIECMGLTVNLPTVVGL